jgi:hypothetical protein
MKRFPSELADVLSPRGRRALAGKVPELNGVVLRDGLAYDDGLLDPRFCRAVPGFLSKHFDDLLEHKENKLMPAGFGLGEQRLHKVMRARSVTHSVAAAMERFEALGLAAFWKSESFLKMAEVLTGKELAGPVYAQVLRNVAGDYAGPHIDSSPQDPYAKDGYIDIHFTFSTPGVKRQLLVFEEHGHLTGVREMNSAGGLTAYALPRWHYTTPLEASKPNARRYILISGFMIHPNAPKELLRHPAT